MSLLTGLLIGYGVLGLLAFRPLAGYLAYKGAVTSRDPEWGFGTFCAFVVCGLWPAALVATGVYYLVRPFRVGAERKAVKERALREIKEKQRAEELRIAELERETGVPEIETEPLVEAPSKWYPESDEFLHPFSPEWFEWEAKLKRQARLDGLWDRIKP